MLGAFFLSRCRYVTGERRPTAALNTTRLTIYSIIDLCPMVPDVSGCQLSTRSRDFLAIKCTKSSLSPHCRGLYYIQLLPDVDALPSDRQFVFVCILGKFVCYIIWLTEDGQVFFKRGGCCECAGVYTKHLKVPVI